jgi:hypothetical protein
MVPIDGLGQPFTVASGEKIYLEVLFDLNGNPIMANIAHCQGGWGKLLYGVAGEQFPMLAGVVDNTNIGGAREDANLADAAATYVEPCKPFTLNFTTAENALLQFKNLTPRYNQFYAWYLIGYCTTGPQTGFSMAGSGADTAFTVVQCLDSHLMLQGFCQGGVPCKVPMPYSGVFEQMLPEPTFTQSGAVVKIIAPGGYADVAVRYSIDGGEWVEYTGNITADRGAHKILAYATLVDYVQSGTASFNFTVT